MIIGMQQFSRVHFSAPCKVLSKPFSPDGRCIKCMDPKIRGNSVRKVRGGACPFSILKGL